MRCLDPHESRLSQLVQYKSHPDITTCQKNVWSVGAIEWGLDENTSRKATVFGILEAETKGICKTTVSLDQYLSKISPSAFQINDSLSLKFLVASSIHRGRWKR